MSLKKVVRLDKKKMNTWEDSLKSFLFWKQAQGISQTTLNDYQCHVRMFFKRFSDSWDNQLLRESILEYMSDQIKPATYNLRLVYLRAFFQWCMEEGFIEKNPLQGFKRRKAPGRIVDVSEDSLMRLLRLPDQNTFVGLRDYALMLLTLDTGVDSGLKRRSIP